jgi:hypothetical protein
MRPRFGLLSVLLAGSSCSSSASSTQADASQPLSPSDGGASESSVRDSTLGASDSAQPSDAGNWTFPDPSRISPPGLVEETEEPAAGFTGACLVDTILYEAQLPLVCYAPTGPVEWGVNQLITFPAASVSLSRDSLPPTYDSYLAVETCFPQADGGGCPFGSSLVSRSCCDLGITLVALGAGSDGGDAEGVATVTGYVRFRPSPPSGGDAEAPDAAP